MQHRQTVLIRRWILLFLLVTTGCGTQSQPKPDGVQVSGKVLLPNGSPLTGGTLVLRPEAGLYGATALIQKDGSFELVDPQGEKSVVPGKYLVYVRFNSPEQKALGVAVNPRYQNSEDGDSDIAVDIPAAQRDLIIRLKR
jgi:hypothetical protein